MVDSLDSGSSAHSGHAGSSPASRTNKKDIHLDVLFIYFVGLEPITMQVSGGHLLPPVFEFVATSIFFCMQKKMHVNPRPSQQ